MVYKAANRPDVSVVICYHVGSLLFDCLRSLKQTEGVSWEAIIISSVANLELPDDLANIGLIIHSLEGPAYKRNLGVAASHADTIVFLDDDVTINAYTLFHLWEALQEKPMAGMVYAKIHNMERPTELDDAGSFLTWTGFLWARADSQQDHGQYDEPCRILASKSATCAARRIAFEDANGFDPAYFILGEESDLSWRMWLLGWEVWYWPAATSAHAFNTKYKPTGVYYTNERIHRLGARNYLWMLTTNLPAAWLLWVLPIQLSVWMLAAATFSIKGQHGRGLQILRGILDYFATLPQTLKKRRIIQVSKKVSHKELMLIIRRGPGMAYYLNRFKRYMVGIHG